MRSVNLKNTKHAMGNLKDKIKGSKRLSAWAHFALKPANQYRPRWWVRTFLNPFKHKKGKGTHVSRNARMDVMPYNHFQTGEKCLIEDFTTINNAVGPVSIGHRSLIGLSSVIIGPVSIGNDVMLAQNVVLSGLNHQYKDVTKPIKEQPIDTKPITVEDGAWIGANAVITAGVTIGKNAVVAGGSVVVNDVDSFSVVVGNPARVVKRYCNHSKSWLSQCDMSKEEEHQLETIGIRRRVS